MANPQAGTLPTDMQNLVGAETRRDSSDRQLLERFIGHCDEAAFAGLVRRHGGIVWGVCRHVLHQTPESEPAPGQDEPAAAEPTRAFVSFPCSQCGKDLKARAELAGKKLKCSGCGKAVRVPDTAVG